MRLHVGQPVPHFQARSDQGEILTPEALRGRWAVLHFYGNPANEETARQIQDFEVALTEFGRLGARVIGIGSGTEAQQAHLRERLGLTFALIPDGNGEVARAFGLGNPGTRLWTWLWPQAQRQTFLLDPQGGVAYHWARARATEHAQAVLSVLCRREAKS